MVLERLYPKAIDLRNYPQSSWSLTKGTATYQPLTLTGGNPDGYLFHSTITTLDYIDMSDFSSLTLAFRYNANDSGIANTVGVSFINEQGQATSKYTSTSLPSTSVTTATIDLSSLSGNYKIMVDWGCQHQLTLLFNELKLQ